jgi:S1-C subfamily serine protease
VENPTSTTAPVSPDTGRADTDAPDTTKAAWLPPLAPGAEAPRTGHHEPPIELYDADFYDPAPAAVPPPSVSAPAPVRAGFWMLFAAAIVGAAVTVALLVVAGVIDVGSADEASTTTASSNEREVITISGDGASPVAVGAKVTPSIVTVETGVSSSGQFAAFGSGSGVVLTTDGLIATNHHVIEGATSARVVFQDGSIHRARVVGSDPITDLAVLRIDAQNLVPVELGATSALSIGDAAIAIGNPLAQQGGASLTLGVVSAFNREVGLNGGDRLFGMIQTDAPITQGSSGGALVDGSGRLIGITTAIGVSSAGAEGIGYAIPVELVTRITDEIIATGTVRHPFLGVRLEDSFEEAAGVLTPDGAVVTGFVEGANAAADAGILEGDVIVGIDDDDVRTLDDLVNSLRLYMVGDEISLTVSRGAEEIVLDVTLGERPEDL